MMARRSRKGRCGTATPSALNKPSARGYHRVRRNCGADFDLYSLAGGYLCLGCIGAAVSMAANDLWPGGVSYSREFEAEVLM